MSLKCIVPDCKAECQTLFRFPCPRTRIAQFRRWLKMLHIDILLYSLSSDEVYAAIRICGAHFDASCKILGNQRLYANAVPTIGLPVPRTLITEESVPGSSTTVAHNVKAAVHFRWHIAGSSKQIWCFRRRLAAAKRYATLPHFKKLCLTTSAEKFLRKQILKGKNPAGSQFTQREKKQCLTLLQKYPESYHLLQRIFNLPDKQTLVKFLSRMSLNCGMNEHLFHALKKDVRKLEAHDKFCVVMFDEMRLQAQLRYNKKQDIVEGFVDNGRQRSAVLADRALVFMVRGIRSNWKQPVAFTFSNGASTSAELVEQLSTVIDSLFAIGLRPIATVCDQTATNVNAVNTLLRSTEESYRQRAEPWRGEFFTVRNKKIFPLYDMPHLLKGIRNHMLTKVLRFTENNKTLEAKWEYLVAAYEFDRKNPVPNYTMLTRITHAHVYPTKMQRNRVALCSQVFSQKVAAIMHWFGKFPPERLVPGTHGTARLFLFFDKLFDSVNSRSFDNIKQLRTPLTTRTSAHLKFWHEAIKVLSSMEFIDPGSGKVVRRPRTVTNWIATLRGLHLLWLNLIADGFKHLQVRNCNQDPLENFFTSIRCRGARNANPTCRAFIAAFKTLTLNNFPVHWSVDANCQEDRSEKALCSRDELFAWSKKPVEVSSSFTYSPSDISEEELAANTSLHCEKQIAANSSSDCEKELPVNTAFYCCGFLMKQLRPVFKKCTVCNTDLFARVTHGNVTNKRTRLIYVSSACATAFVTVKKIAKQMIPKYCSHSNLCSNIAAFVQANVDFTFLTCHMHKERIKEIFIKKTIEVILHGWIKDVNEILNGKNVRGTSNDGIKKQALLYYKKKQKEQIT